MLDVNCALILVGISTDCTGKCNSRSRTIALLQPFNSWVILIITNRYYELIYNATTFNIRMYDLQTVEMYNIRDRKDVIASVTGKNLSTV